jgi:hypothetical protein
MVLLMIALMGGWRYEGFASDPAGSGSGPGPTAIHAPPGGVSPPSDVGRVAADSITVPIGVPTPTVPPPALPAPEMPPEATPALWRLADARGQVWEHTDPDWLGYWVDQCNTRDRPGDRASSTSPRADPWGR